MSDSMNIASVNHQLVQQTADTQLGTQQVTSSSGSPSSASSKADDAQLAAKDLQGLTDQLNELMKQGQRAISFSVDDTANEVVVSVLDKQTNEVIRQIPSPEALKLKQHLDGVIGLLFSDQA